MTRAVLVAGTWGWRGEVPEGAWWRLDSPFAKALPIPVVSAGPDAKPFVWSTDLNGTPFESQHVDWRAGAAALYEYCVPSLCPSSRLPPKETTIICHSHGLQVVLYAAAAGLEIGHLVSVCSPIRQDMQTVTQAARPKIQHWTHLYSDGSDGWQIAGDDGWHDQRDAPLADENLCVPGVGHTGLLDDPKNFPLWAAHPAWLTFDEVTHG